ncbi:hypothetical protein AX16_009082 [Volvariella volvacea WC 439]|nr:hypothetical protein AX16_009082 [Volvariella volvacea WC 439]
MSSSTSKPIITVITGTGAQGRAVSRHFNASGRWHVRILTRNPQGPIAQSLQQEGVEVLQGNFENKDDLKRAFKGAWAVYSVTIPPWHPSYSNKLDEYTQGVLQANAAKEENVKFFIFSTLPYVGPEFMGLGGVELYDSKARTNDYITSIGLPAVYVSTAAYVDNIHNWPLIHWIDDGKRLEFWNHTVAKDKPMAFLWVDKDLGPSILALAESFYNFKKPLLSHPLNHSIQPLASWRGTWGAVSREIEKQTGIPTIHTTVPTADERWHKDRA